MSTAKVSILALHTSSQRDASWALVQDADGSLHVEYTNDDDHSDDHRMSINDFLTGSAGASARAELMKRIGRLFAK